MTKIDPLRGLNPDQSGPREKIQNGDPRSGPNRDQRSGCAESGGPSGSLQQGPTGTLRGQVPAHEGLVHRDELRRGLPNGVSGETLPPGAYDRAGQSPALQSPGTATLKEATEPNKGADSPDKIKADADDELDANKNGTGGQSTIDHGGVKTTETNLLKHGPTGSTTDNSKTGLKPADETGKDAQEHINKDEDEGVKDKPGSTDKPKSGFAKQIATSEI